MARGDGAHRTNVRNVKIADSAVSNIQAHNERDKKSYSNQDIVLERTSMNMHFKLPEADYLTMFKRLEEDKIISTRGLKETATKFGELIFDVNSSYFDEHGGYDFAKKFYAEAYNAAIKIVGSEEYILSAVLHADERNRALSDRLGRDVYHYHMHVVYIPIVEKEIKWTQRCKDHTLAGTYKECINQVSMRKKWASKPALDDKGHPLVSATGKTIYKKSYSVLQDQFFEHMYAAGYTDIFRGECGSTDEHLTITQYKVMKEQERLSALQKNYAIEKENFDKAVEDIQQKKLDINRVDNIQTKPTRFGNKIILDKDDFDMLTTAAKKHIIQEKKESFLQKTLDAADHLIAELKNLIANLERKLAEISRELIKLDFFKKENRELSVKNDRLRAKIRAYDEVISNHNLSPYFHRECEKEESRDDDR